MQSRRKTSDIQKLEFQVNLPVKSGANIQQTFCMFDVGGQRGERRKWIQVFDGVSAVMFLIDSSSFDAIDDENGRNKLRETINLFYEVWTTRFLLNSNFVLLFNKQDILKEKIERGHKIEDHFPEYKLYKFQPQDRHLHGRAGEKLNLFRTTSSRSSTTRNSSQRSSSGGSSPASGPAGTHSGLKATSTNPLSRDQSNPLREKRKTSSLYRFGINRNNNNDNRTAEPKPTATGISRTVSSGPTTLPVSQSVEIQMNPLENYGTTTTSNSQPVELNSDQNISTTTTTTATATATITSPKTTVSTKTPSLTAATDSTKQDEQQASADHLAYLKARSFIRDKFLQITRQVDHDQRKFSSPSLSMYNSKGSRVDQPKRNVCYHYTTATDTENIRDLFENLQKMVIKSTMKDLG